MLKSRLLPLTGIAFVALILSSVFIVNTPDSTASAGTVLAYYRTHGHVTFISALLTGLGIIFGLFFYGYLREYLRQDRATRWLASTAFGGALLFATGGALAAGSFFALSDKPDVLTAATAQSINLIQGDVGTGLMQAGLGVFYLATAAAILRGRLLPAWLGWVSVVVGLVAASVFLTFIAFIATALWVVTVAIMLSVKAAHERAEQQSTQPEPEYVGTP
ncbi:MAG: hypothetical protein QOH87_4086 [Trebonia sp.]|nr:hypothetical protein [Trebonia sp.]